MTLRFRRGKSATPSPLNTRIIFLTNPNNPTGQLIPRDAIREIVRRSPPAVTIVLDEAYYDFCGETFLRELGAHPNVVIGRTFAKAHGLAGLRAGCLIGDPRRLESAREVVPPYSLSVFAVAGWRAALRDREYLEWYRAQVDGIARARIQGVRPARTSLLEERRQFRVDQRAAFRGAVRHRRSLCGAWRPDPRPLARPRLQRLHPHHGRARPPY